MAISDELTRIQGAKADIKASIELKGVQVPASALIDDYSGYVDQISGGGGGQAEQDLIDLIERDITSITIPSGVQTIGDNAFAGCTVLTSVTMGSGLTTIGQYAFSSCTRLTSVNLPNNLNYIPEGTFKNCRSLTSITIPNNVTTIGSSAFSGCYALTNITIPNIVTSIGSSAFQSCKELTSITIPSSVTSIGGFAFQGCTVLTSITVEATTPPTIGGNAAFDNTNNCPIYVPAESVSAYQTANRWSSLASRIQAIPTT